MSATVTTTYARAPIADVLSVESVRGLSDADLKKTYGMIWAPGQLWERVAETPSNAPAPLTARQDEGIVRAYQRVESRAEFDHIKRMQGAPVGNYGTNGPRAMIDGEYTAPRHASGIIRTGQRIK